MDGKANCWADGWVWIVRFLIGPCRVADPVDVDWIGEAVRESRSLVDVLKTEVDILSLAGVVECSRDNWGCELLRLNLSMLRVNLKTDWAARFARVALAGVWRWL